MSVSIVKTEDISSVSGRTGASQTPEEVEESLRLIEDLKFFLTTAPANWQENQVIRRYYLSNDEGFVSCVFWNNLYYITGTDIVRCCAYRMQKFGREIVERKKFEEGIFSDLRNLKCGIDATLEKPKSEFLAFLCKNMCLKTQKKQKVFFWFSVPHDRLFADALERDLKRSSTGVQPTTRAVSEPALSFQWEASSNVSLYDQITHHMDAQRGESRPSSNDDLANDSREQERGEDEEPELQHNSRSEDNQTITSNESNSDDAIPIDQDAQLLRNNKVPYELSSTNYQPQQLVVAQADQDNTGGTNEFDSLDTNLKPSDILTSTNEDDDFPLDYFPVEIEYSQTSLDSSLHQPPQNSKYSNQMMFYEDMDGMMGPKYPISGGLYEEPFFREEMAASNPARYMMHPPMSATRAQFITNGEYYSKSKDNGKSEKTHQHSNREDQRRNSDDNVYSSPLYPGNTDTNAQLNDEDDIEVGSQQNQHAPPDHNVGEGYPAEGGFGTDEYPPAYNNRRMAMNDSMIHPYTGMLLNPYMFYKMMSVDPSMNMGMAPVTDPFYGHGHSMEPIHDAYPPQEMVYPSNYRTTPKAAYFNMRSPYGRHFPPPSAMNPYYTPYHRRQPSSGTRRYFNKASMINRKPKSPPRKNMVSKPFHKSNSGLSKSTQDILTNNGSQNKEGDTSTSNSNEESSKYDSM